MNNEWYYIEIIGYGFGPLQVPRPEVLPAAGDILVFDMMWESPIGKSYDIGDEIHLMRRTDDAPHGRSSSLGNWVAISKHGCTVWSNIEWMLASEIVKQKL